MGWTCWIECSKLSSKALNGLAAHDFHAGALSGAEPDVDPLEKRGAGRLALARLAQDFRAALRVHRKRLSAYRQMGYRVESFHDSEVTLLDSCGESAGSLGGTFSSSASELSLKISFRMTRSVTSSR